MKHIFFSSAAAPPVIYTLSLHDALPIYRMDGGAIPISPLQRAAGRFSAAPLRNIVLGTAVRSEEHTSELQSRGQLVCRLLLEKKKNNHEHHLARLGTRHPPWHAVSGQVV